MLQERLDKNRYVFPLLILGAWTAYGFFFATPSYLRGIYSGDRYTFQSYLVLWLICGYSWAILTVPILRFLRRFSLARLGFAKFFLVHPPPGVPLDRESTRL